MEERKRSLCIATENKGLKLYVHTANPHAPTPHCHLRTAPPQGEPIFMGLLLLTLHVAYVI